MFGLRKKDDKQTSGSAVDNSGNVQSQSIVSDKQNIPQQASTIHLMPENNIAFTEAEKKGEKLKVLIARDKGIYKEKIPSAEAGSQNNSQIQVEKPAEKLDKEGIDLINAAPITPIAETNQATTADLSYPGEQQPREKPVIQDINIEQIQTQPATGKEETPVQQTESNKETPAIQRVDELEELKKKSLLLENRIQQIENTIQKWI